jgi:hypothetical protein
MGLRLDQGKGMRLFIRGFVDKNGSHIFSTISIYSVTVLDGL